VSSEGCEGWAAYPSLVGPTGAPLVSVIVPVRNNAAGVEALLASLEAQTVRREAFEVIIGDDGSDDRSVERFATRDGRIRVESGPPRTS
jgi:glycosyltransferase involved in cell wall biosynthesis